MRPLLRRALKVCRQERAVPPSVEMKNTITVLRYAIKVCRQESGECVSPNLRGDSLFGIGIED